MISYYELLGMIKEDKEPRKIRVHLTSEPREYRAVYDKGVYDYFDFNYYELVGKEDDNYKEYLADSYLESMMFDETIEILEEEKELHANKIVFNCDNSKRECVINLDENDLGIDKLHIDNCYFYKENDKWYVRKYDFKTFNLEEKKIPEKIEYIVTDENGEFSINGFTFDYEQKMQIIDTLNQVIDYLKSKGE